MHGRRTVTAAVACAVASVLALGAAAGAQTSDLQTSDVQDHKCETGKRAKGDGDVCTDGSKQATEIVDAVRQAFGEQPINGVAFGVWKDGEELVTGALGNAMPGVPATRDVHFRIGNTTESFTTTLLLMLVDDGTVSLDDPISEWYPDLPEADVVTLDMLARSTSGYPDYVTNDAFVDAFFADPFAQWEADELLEYGFEQPLVFSPPGSSWAFSDTNFVLLGEILAKAGGKPVKQQLQTRILDELDLEDTLYTLSSDIFPPVLHGYSSERDTYEDSGFWSPTWTMNAGNMSSNLADMGKWAQALGTGELVSKKLHERQVGDENVGLGEATEDYHYAMGSGVKNGWIINNPQLMGYTGVVAYFPDEDLAVVVNATPTPEYEVGQHLAAAVFNAIGEVVTPDSAPDLSVRPRG